MRISHSITGIIDLTGGNSMGRKWLRGIALCLVLIMFTGCGTGTQFDDVLYEYLYLKRKFELEY